VDFASSIFIITKREFMNFKFILICIAIQKHFINWNQYLKVVFVTHISKIYGAATACQNCYALKWIIAQIAYET
jgi:hypothetical protein